MSTIFYNHAQAQREKELPLTFLLIEVIDLMQEAADDMGAYAMLQVASEWAGLLAHGEVMTEKQAVSLLRRIKEPAEKAAAGKPKRASSPVRGKRSFGTDFLKFYEKLPLQDKCLYAADYNFEVARLLYCVYDKAVSEEIIKQKFDADFAKMQVGYEAVVFGMGGSFGNGSGTPEGEVTDFAPDPMSDDYLNAAQNFVNMQNSYRSRK